MGMCTSARNDLSLAVRLVPAYFDFRKKTVEDP